MDYPKRIRQHKNESDSFSIILYKLKDIGIFRNITESDYGIDFEIEVVDGDMVEGHCVKVQVKSSDHLNIRESDGQATVGGIKQTTLNYWAELSYNVPVVAMAVDLKTEHIYVSDPLFWQCVTSIDGDEHEEDEKVVKPSTKTIVFGNSCDNGESINRLRRIAKHYSLRDFLNAHKWILRNMKNIFQMYADIAGWDPSLCIDSPGLFKEFLEYSKIFLQVGLWPDEAPRKETFSLLDYNVYYRKSDSQAPYAYYAKEAIENVLKLVISMLNCYKSQVLQSAYYWMYKDPDYLKLVYCTKYPNSDNQDEMERFGYEDLEDDNDSGFFSFLDEKQKEYGIKNNDFILKAYYC